MVPTKRGDQTSPSRSGPSFPLKGGGQEGVGAVSNRPPTRRTRSAPVHFSRHPRPLFLRGALARSIRGALKAAPTPSCPPPFRGPFRGRDPTEDGSFCHLPAEASGGDSASNSNAITLRRGAGPLKLRGTDRQRGPPRCSGSAGSRSPRKGDLAGSTGHERPRRLSATVSVLNVNTPTRLEAPPRLPPCLKTELMMPNLQYRPMLEGDVAAIARVHRRACLIAYRFMNWSYSEVEVRDWYAGKFPGLGLGTGRRRTQRRRGFRRRAGHSPRPAVRRSGSPGARDRDRVVDRRSCSGRRRC